MPIPDYSLDNSDPLFDRRVYRAFQYLSFHECLVLWFTYCGSPTTQDKWLAERLGMSGMRISQIRKEAKVKLERKLEAFGILPPRSSRPCLDSEN